MYILVDSFDAASVVNVVKFCVLADFYNSLIHQYIDQGFSMLSIYSTPSR